MAETSVTDLAWRRIVGVGARQAFGLGFDPLPDDKVARQRVADGRILLPPHPEWVVPNEGIDWHADPFGQRNWCAQLHMLRWLDPVRRIARSQEVDDSALWARHVKDWLAKNSDPSSTTIWAWKDMVDAMRSEVLLYGSTLFDAPQPWLIEAIENHGSWLSDDRNLGHSNHALHQHAALFQIASALGNSKWEALAVDRLRNYFAADYDEEGVNVEGAPGYWELNLRWANEVAKRLELEDTDASFVRKAIDRSAEAIAQSTRPDGKLEAIGDTVSAKPAGFPHPGLEYIVTAGASGIPPVETTKVYKAGYAFGRTGWGETQRQPIEETFYSLVFGRADKVHGHQDGGSVTYFANSRPLLTEAGKYSYTSTPGRIYAIGRAGHNVAIVRGAQYNRKAVVELAAHRVTSRYDYFKLRDRGYKGVELTREVIFAKATESLLIIDTARSRRPVEVETRWHLEPGAEVTHVQGSIGARYGPAEFTLIFGGRLPEISITSGSSEPFEGWVSPRWHELKATHLIKARRAGTSFRTVCAIEKVADDRGRLQSIEVDGRQGFVVKGPNGSEFISVVNSSVDIRHIDPVTGLPEDPVVEGAHSDAVHAQSFEQLVEVEELLQRARNELWTSVDDQTVSTLDCTLSSGTDHGIAATLADIAALTGRHSAARIPRSTRDGFALGGRQEHHFVDGRLPTYAYRTASELTNLPDEQDAVLLVEAGSLLLPVRYFRGSEPALIVGFTGAIDRAREKLPRFERMRSLRGQGPSVLVFSDPTLDLAAGLSLGWYLGTATDDLVPRIAAVVRTIADTVGAEERVLLGSSGGGFAALQVSTEVPDASVLAMNPQTDVRRYHKRFAQAALEAVFGAAENISDTSRVCVIERFAAGTAASRILFVTNVGDGHHSLQHASPFQAWYETVKPDFELEFRSVDWGRGHVSPRPQQFSELLRDVRRSRGSHRGASRLSTN